MARYGLLYVGEPQFGDDQEAAQADQQRWFQWIGGLGEAVVTPGMPMGPATRVSVEGVAPAPTEGRLTGMTIVEADSMDAAIEMAKGSPYVEHADTAIDVVELFQMG